MDVQFQKGIELLAAARQAAALADHYNAEALYQDAIAAFSKSAKRRSKEQVDAFIGLADSIDARGGDSSVLRAVAKAMAGACDANA
jgi:hypothetical protein